jgi:hypothetical protein
VARVDTTNNNADWTKTKQSHTSLVHDTGLANGHRSQRHAALPEQAQLLLVLRRQVVRLHVVRRRNVGCSARRSRVSRPR